MKSKIPKWCKRHSHLKISCCCCGERDIYFQQGDGRDIHSLCKKCYYKHEHFCKGEKIWMPICAECKQEDKTSGGKNGEKARKNKQEGRNER